MAIELVHVQRANEWLEEAALDVVHDHTAIGPLFAPYRPVPTVVRSTDRCRLDAPRLRLAAWRLVAISDAQRTAAPQLPWVTTVHNGNRRGGVPVRIREG